MVSYVKLSSFTLCFVWLNTDTLYFTATLSLSENPKCQHEILGCRQSFTPKHLFCFCCYNLTERTREGLHEREDKNTAFNTTL